MYFMPIDKMWERVENERQDSDRALLDALFGLSEMIVKTVVLGMVATVDDRNRDQYRQVYRLIRASGLGEWEQVLEEVLTGPASQHVLAEAQPQSRELTMRCAEQTWQHNAVYEMHNALQLLVSPGTSLQTKVSGKQWISLFVQVRNKAKAHGAITASTVRQLCVLLEASCKQFLDGFSLFRQPWAYLHRSLSGKYKITKISADGTAFDWLKSRRAVDENVKLADGVYLFMEHLIQVPLIESDADGLDFSYPNGGATAKRYELLSYITGVVHESDISPFLSPPTELPGSETRALRDLRDEGRCFGNLPPVQRGYITRERLENELHDVLRDDRHPMITLVGRGGIGKTSLALRVLHRLAHEDRFGLILWFSARDIDLLPQGPKRVKPDILTVDDVAKELLQLLKPLGVENTESGTAFFARALTCSPFEGMPILFVFDNFETVRAPQDLYSWIDESIRLPNKVLITTRSRDFKGDYPVEVSGMSPLECDQLIDATITLLNITTPLDADYRQKLIEESDGHPYVIKVLLGEVKKTRSAVKVERIVAGQDEILNALFERTYNVLSMAAQRIFLTLASWRSAIPQLAVEAVMLRPQNDRMDVERAIDELKQSSLIDVSVSNDGAAFLQMPLVASVFGKRKLAVSPWKGAIESDRDVLLSWGVTQPEDIQRGIAPRIEQMFRSYAEHIAKKPSSIEEYIPVMEFVARNYPFAWLYIAEILKEDGGPNAIAKAKACISRYLEVAESPDDQRRGWRSLASYCRSDGDLDGETHAILELCLVAGTSMVDISNSVSRLIALRTSGFRIGSEEAQSLARQVATTMASRIAEASATDCSRLAWLYLHLHDEDKARHYTEYGLKLDADNEYCDRLAHRLGIY